MEHLRTLYSNLAPGNALNVSNMDLRTGRGVRTVPRPRGGGRSFVYVPEDPDLAIVSSSYPQFILAIYYIFGPEGLEQLATEIADAGAFLQHAGPEPVMRAIEGRAFEQASPVRVSPPTFSPPRVPSPTRLPPQLSPVRTPSPAAGAVLPPQLSPRVARRVTLEDLRDKVRNLDDRHVLDVSNLSANGTGARIVPVPKTNRSGRLWIEGVPIISNNSATYLMALRAVYGPAAENDESIRRALAQLRAANPNW